jgi:mannose-1-phosphate guanylyltransferase
LSKMKKMTYAVILAGGKGERFWPKSRRQSPKQLLSIISSKTMIEMTVDRIKPMIPDNMIIVVASEEIKDNLLDIDLGIPDENYLFEPMGKNTAPAIGFAAFHIMGKDKDSTMVVLPADHHIEEEDDFRECLNTAIEMAEKDYLITFGIVPTRPETGYGYIEAGEGIEKGVCVVKKFKEKPSQKKANEFIKNEKFLWNSGIFVWKTGRIIEEFHRFQSEFAAGMEKCFKLDNASKRKKKIKELYEETEPISIDYAVMERASDVAVVRASFGWDDVGSWNALERVRDKDRKGNIISGDSVLIDTRDSIIISDKGIVGAIGVSNFAIVHTEDATLVFPKDRDQEVKEIVRKLRSEKKLKKYA